jgi:hypothetical protein
LTSGALGTAAARDRKHEVALTAILWFKAQNGL